MRANNLRREYLSGVCRALAECVEEGMAVRLNSERDGDELVLQFRLDDADGYHRLLAERAAQQQRGGLAADDTPWERAG